MSELLKSAISDFLRRLPTERHFDLPFQALLRLHGFFDIHFTDGPFEFGKDFVAKKREGDIVTQYAFQSKRGDKSGPQWTQEIQPQCEEMLTQTVAHPSYDGTLPLTIVVVLTGRLVGKAIESSRAYKAYIAKRERVTLEIWDQDDLIEQLSATACLGAGFDWREFGHLLWEAERGDTTPTLVEVYTRRWSHEPNDASLWRAVLEYSIVRDELNRAGLGFHSFRLLLGVARSLAVALDSDVASKPVIELIEAGLKREIAGIAESILAWFDDVPIEHADTFLLGDELAEVVAVSVRAYLLLEIVSIYDLACNGASTTNAPAMRRMFERTLRLGATLRPLSNDFAASIIVLTTTATRLGVCVDDWLRAVGDWVCATHTDISPGLAPARSSPSDELWRTLARMVDNPAVAQLRESSLAAAVLDASSIARRPSVYDAAVQAMIGCEHLIPQRMIPKAEVGQYQLDREGCVRVLGGEYPPHWVGENGWENGRTHAYADSEREMDKRGMSWLGAAVSLLLRDRWWLHSLRKLIEANLTPTSTGDAPAA